VKWETREPRRRAVSRTRCRPHPDLDRAVSPAAPARWRPPGGCRRV